MPKKKKFSGNKVMTPEFRVSFPSIFRPTSFEGQEPKYSLVMLFKKGVDLSELKNAAKKAARDKWKDKIPKGLNLPFRDGDDKADEWEGFEDCIFVRAVSQRKPGLVDRHVNDIIDESDFYAGCFARATVNAFAYDVAGNKGISFGLLNIQKLRDGESLIGTTKPEDDFEELEPLDSEDDSEDDFDW